MFIKPKPDTNERVMARIKDLVVNPELSASAWVALLVRVGHLDATARHANKFTADTLFGATLDKDNNDTILDSRAVLKASHLTEYFQHRDFTLNNLVEYCVNSWDICLMVYAMHCAKDISLCIHDMPNYETHGISSSGQGWLRALNVTVLGNDVHDATRVPYIYMKGTNSDRISALFTYLACKLGVESNRVKILDGDNKRLSSNTCMETADVDYYFALIVENIF